MMSTLSLLSVILGCIVAAGGCVAAVLKVGDALKKRWIAQADNTRAMQALTTAVEGLSARVDAIEGRLRDGL